jgi:branched-chain amino acid transport system substrate-binding protein
LLLWASDVAALGLPATQGVVLTEAWYWDMTDSSRAWTKRWQVERPGKVPTSAQAGVYSAVTHFLKIVDALKSDTDGGAVAAKMKEVFEVGDRVRIQQPMTINRLLDRAAA